jgi:hypothetical protein
LIKNLINDLIDEKDISIPKKISIKLNSKNYIEKRTEGNKVLDVSTLTQVQNYVKYLKSKVCTNNNVQEIKILVDDHQYYEDINPNKYKHINRWAEISRKWLKIPKLKSFHSYFEEKWIKSKFNKWSVFHSPPGFTTTNNPIESFKKTIKQFFSIILKLNLVTAFEVYKTLIYEESSKPFKYETTVKVTKTLENKSKRLEALKFVKKTSTEYVYNHKNDQVSIIDFFKKTCTCNSHTDRGICLHLVYVARIEKVVLPGMVFVEKFSIRNRKKFDKKTKTNTDFFDDDVEMIYSEDECYYQLIIEKADQVELVTDYQIEQVKLATEIPVRRGRPLQN